MIFSSARVPERETVGEWVEKICTVISVPAFCSDLMEPGCRSAGNHVGRSAAGRVGVLDVSLDATLAVVWIEYSWEEEEEEDNRSRKSLMGCCFYLVILSLKGVGGSGYRRLLLEQR